MKTYTNRNAKDTDGYLLKRQETTCTYQRCDRNETFRDMQQEDEMELKAVKEDLISSMDVRGLTK